MPGEFLHGLQSAPRWLSEKIENLLGRSEVLGRKSYERFTRLSPEQQAALDREVSALLALKKRPEGAFVIPFSVTGSSEPLDFTPDELRRAASDERFARKLFRETTDIHRVSKDDIDDFRKRAGEQYEENLPQIRRREASPPAAAPAAPVSLSSTPAAPPPPTPASAPASPSPSSAAAAAAVSPGPSPASPSAAAASSSSSAVPRPSPLIADIFKRAGVEREVNRLMEKQGIIAPMNERHEQAIRMLERSFDDDTLDLAKQEVLESRKHDSLKAVKPLVESALEGPDDYMRRYMDDYRTSVIKAYRDEAEEDLNEKILPAINMEHVKRGNYYSGARMHALQKAKAEKEKSLRREIAHLLNHARDRGMEHYESAKGRALSAADKMLAATEAERGAGHERGERLRGHAVTKHGLVHSAASALGQVAKAKQDQLQHEINLKRAEFEREKAHPHEQLGRELAAVSGVPMPATHSVSGAVGGVPVAQNLYTLGAGALGLAAGAAGARTGHAKGGHVKKRYADEGSVDNLSKDEIGRDIRNLIQDQRAADIRRHQAALQTNPLQSWLTHVGEEMLSNPSADPLLSMGRGTANTMRHLEASKERAANLYDKIQDSRLRQYQILAAYENQKAQRDLQSTSLKETSKHRQAQLNQARDFHNDMLGLQRSKLSTSESSPPKVSITERKLENDAKKDMLRAIRMKKEVNRLDKLIENTSTGPIIGGIKGVLPKTRVDNQIEVGTNKLILEMHQGMKNIPRSEEFMKRIETTKPNIRNHPEANKEALELMREGANDVEEHSISTLLSSGWTPERIEKQFKVKIPEHLYEGSSDHSLPPEEEVAPEAESDMVKMIGPDGSFAYVPTQNVKSALSAGATYAQ